MQRHVDSIVDSIIDSLSIKPNHIHSYEGCALLVFINYKIEYLTIYINDTSSYNARYELKSADDWYKETDFFNLLDLEEKVKEFMKEVE